jgi:hypothetical protein
MNGLSEMNGDGATENVDEDHSEHFDAINLLLPKALDKIFISCH